MKIFKTTKCLGITLLILSFVILLASCTSGVETNTVETTTITPPTTTAPPTTTVPPTTVEPKPVYTPVVGTEFPQFNREQDKWIIIQFEYDSIQEPTSEWHFPWSLTIRNKTETELELTAYIAYIGYHLWIGHITNTPFVLKGGETKIISGEGILSDAFVDQIAYIREVIIDVHIAER